MSSAHDLAARRRLRVMTQAHGAGSALPSPACGRRWREAPDEGLQCFTPSADPHPNPLPQAGEGAGHDADRRGSRSIPHSNRKTRPAAVADQGVFAPDSVTLFCCRRERGRFGLDAFRRCAVGPDDDSADAADGRVPRTRRNLVQASRTTDERRRCRPSIEDISRPRWRDRPRFSRLEPVALFLRRRLRARPCRFFLSASPSSAAYSV